MCAEQRSSCGDGWEETRGDGLRAKSEGSWGQGTLVDPALGFVAEGSTTASIAHLCSKPTSLRGLTWPPCTPAPSAPAGRPTDSGARGAGQEVTEGRAGSPDRSGQSSLPQAEPSR